MRSTSRTPAGCSAPGSLTPAVATTGGTARADLDLSYQSGLEVKARSQWAYARMRFFRHRLAVASLIILIVAALVAIFANSVAPTTTTKRNYNVILQGPTLSGWHLFGTDELGRDYLSRVIFGLRTSLWVAFFVAGVATVLGTIAEQSPATTAERSTTCSCGSPTSFS